ncbi:MAG: hypothetical protein K9M07_02295 [Simkaniaceae bacterium]|nr:hypothetical protein [Simkaniaceae bacterium]
MTVERHYVDERQLASTFVQSPDPLQKNPPVGEKLWINWNIPSSAFKSHHVSEDDSTQIYERCGLILTLKVIFKDLNEDIVSYPVLSRKGSVVYSLLNQEYEKTGGILTYYAEIATIEGKVLEVYKQQMWFKPIHIKS